MNEASSLLPEIDRLLSAAARPAGEAVEVTLVASEDRTIGWGEGRPNINNAASSTGVCVRVLADGGQGIATTTVPEPASAAALATRAAEAARVSGKDPHRALAQPAGAFPADVPSDPAALTRPAEEILDELRALEQDVLKTDRRLAKVVRMNVSERRSARAVANSFGVRAASCATGFGFSLELLAVDGSTTEAAWDYRGGRFASGVPWREMTLQAAEDAVRSLGGAPLATGKYPVVLHPRVGAQLLNLVGEALSAEAVQRERSFLRGWLGKAPASPVLTVVDDPFLKDGVASEPFDDEGVAHERIEPISKGTLTSYFYDLRSAARDGRASNGHASKESLGAPPHPGPTNLFVQPGTARLADMLGSASQVFLLREVMGLHMADPITGEFSLGASGFLYEKGAFARPVRGVTIAGTLAGVLGAVEGVSDDLTFYGSVGSPSLLVAGLTVAGS